MTKMILTNNTASDIVMDNVGQTLPASSTLELDSGDIYSAACDPGMRAGFASGAIGISLNGFVLTKDAVGSSVLSDIAYSSVVTP